MARWIAGGGVVGDGAPDDAVAALLADTESATHTAAAAAAVAAVESADGVAPTGEWNFTGATVIGVDGGGGGGGGVTDHGALTGLGDDDHPQYLNQARGDARYSQLSHTHTASQVSDSTAVGRSVLTAADAAAARSAIGAGTSSLALGSTSGTAAAGNHTHTASGISDSTTVGRSVLTAADAAAARSAIGAGTSNLAIGTTGSTAKAGNYQPTAANISDSTATGRAVLTAADAAAARTAIGAGTSNLEGVGVTKIAPMTQAAYDALSVKDPATLYLIAD